MARLFGVKLPQVTRFELRSRITKLKKNTKQVLYWHYSEFLLRANRNPWYSDVLNRASLSATDGKGLQWAMFKTMKPGFLPSVYGFLAGKLPTILRSLLLVIFFAIQLVINLLHGAYILLAQVNTTPRTKNQVILGRAFTYDILKIAENRGFKTLIIGGASSGGQVTRQMLSHLFPSLQLDFWTKPSDSNLMRDKYHNPQDILPVLNSTQNNSAILRLESKSISEESKNNQEAPAKTTSQKDNIWSKLILILEESFLRSGFVNSILTKFFDKFWPQKPLLTNQNLYQRFPELFEAKQHVKETKPDLILVGIGGGSGKQEFFIDSLYTDPEISFTLATGLGAAFDHLGAGAKQKEAPKLIQKIGLEWLFRLFTQPYRIPRILDSILTLWWWTTVEEFMKTTQHARETVINVVFKQNQQTNEKEFLLVQQRGVLPGDVAWSCVQGQIPASQTTKQAGLRELQEETNLNPEDFTTIESGTPASIFAYTTSFWRFLAMGSKYTMSHNYLHIAKYTGTQTPAVNWENQQAKWGPQSQIFSFLHPHKQADFKQALEILNR